MAGIGKLSKLLAVAVGAVSSGLTAYLSWRDKIPDVKEKVNLADLPIVDEEEIVPEKEEEEQEESEGKKEQKQEEGKSEKKEKSSSSEQGEPSGEQQEEEGGGSEQKEQDVKASEGEEGGGNVVSDNVAEEGNSDEEEEEDDNEGDDGEENGSSSLASSSDSEDGILTGVEGGLDTTKALVEIVKEIIENGKMWAETNNELLSSYKISLKSAELTELLKKLEKLKTTEPSTIQK